MSVKRYNGTSWDVVAGDGVQGPAGASGTAGLTTKGDLLTYNTAATRLGVGTDGQVLTADSAQATGIKWASSGTTFAGAKVYATNSQTISSGSQTTILFPSERYDTNNYHSTTTNTGRFTIPTGKAGYYLMQGQWFAVSNSTGSRSAQIMRNGNQELGNVQAVASNVYMSIPIQAVYYLNEGDYVTLTAAQNSGSNLDTYADEQNTWFSLIYLGV